MKTHAKGLISLLLVGAMLFALAGCEASTSTAESEVLHKIGVAVYDDNDPQMLMFYDYLREYIGASFPVEFYISGDLDTSEDEIAFLDDMVAEGVEGIISFYTADLQTVVAACAERGLYYMMGATSVTDDNFNAVKDNPYFLGVIGPDSNAEVEAGENMAHAFVSDGAKEFLILTGGSCYGNNYMHFKRTVGMLTALQEDLGLTYEMEINDLALIDTLTVIETGREDVRIVICPGYLQMESAYADFAQALADYDYDALLCVMGLSSVWEDLSANILTTDQNLRIGVVDCFSDENYDAVETLDNNGNSMLNYVVGKYASMVAPSFVAMFNALEGDWDVIRPNGEAFRLYQEDWVATNEEEYLELYNYTKSIYENAYSAADLMAAIQAYNADATYAIFEELTVSSDMDSVRGRLSE